MPDTGALDASQNPSAISAAAGDQEWLEREKLRLEIAKLHVETAQLRSWWRDNPFLAYIPHLLTLAGVAVAIWANWTSLAVQIANFDRVKTQSQLDDLSVKKAKLETEIGARTKELVDSKKVLASLKTALAEANGRIRVARDQVTESTALAQTERQRAIEAGKQATEQISIAHKQVDEARIATDRAIKESDEKIEDAKNRTLAAQAEAAQWSFDARLSKLVLQGHAATAAPAVVKPLIQGLQPGPEFETRKKLTDAAIAKSDTPDAVKATLLYVLLRATGDKKWAGDLASLVVRTTKGGYRYAGDAVFAIEAASWSDAEKVGWLTLLSQSVLGIPSNFGPVAPGVFQASPHFYLNPTANNDYDSFIANWGGNRELFFSVAAYARDNCLNPEALYWGNASGEIDFLKSMLPEAFLICAANTLMNEPDAEARRRVSSQFSHSPSEIADSVESNKQRAILLLQEIEPVVRNSHFPVNRSPELWRTWSQSANVRSFFAEWMEKDLTSFRKNPEAFKQAIRVWR